MSRANNVVSEQVRNRALQTQKTGNFGLRKGRNCTIHAYANCCFSYAVAHMFVYLLLPTVF